VWHAARLGRIGIAQIAPRQPLRQGGNIRRPIAVGTFAKADDPGIDFDFEFVNREDRDLYTGLISQTAARVTPEGYIVTVPLAPKTSAEQPGLLYGGHDYAGIGAVANLVMLMTYEWGYTFGPPMAVAPIDKVRQVLDYAVTEIPRSKILMGVLKLSFL